MIRCINYSAHYCDICNEVIHGATISFTNNVAVPTRIGETDICISCAAKLFKTMVDTKKISFNDIQEAIENMNKNKLTPENVFEMLHKKPDDNF